MHKIGIFRAAQSHLTRVKYFKQEKYFHSKNNETKKVQLHLHLFLMYSQTWQKLLQEYQRR
jgi:hypothetical protein